MTTTDNTQAIINVAQDATTPHVLEPGKAYVVASASGTQMFDLTGDAYRDAPRTKAGRTTFRDAASFLAYYGKHHDANSEIYADASSLTITAVLDAHTADGARFGKHRATLSLRTTDAWDQWIAKDGRLMEQTAFAEHLEDHLPELVTPPAAEMLEIASSIQGSTKADFQAGVRLANGTRQLSFVETTTAKAGQKGQLVIPETFEIGLVPFEGSAPYKMSARFRYRIENGGSLRLSYKLDRPGDILKAAFADVLATVAKVISEPVMNGSPAGS